MALRPKVEDLAPRKRMNIYIGKVDLEFVTIITVSEVSPCKIAACTAAP